jgi:hypothetical protein
VLLTLLSSAKYYASAAIESSLVPLTARNVALPSPEKLKKLCLTDNVINYIINMMPCDNVSNMVAIPLSTYKEQSSPYENRLL